MQTANAARAIDSRTCSLAQSYRTEGYILFREPVLSDSRFNNLGAIFESMLANKGSLRSDELDTPHFKNPELLDYLLDDNILDLVEPLIGPDIGLWSSHLICKEPFTGRATPWHDDSTYWEGRFDRTDGIVTIWLAIDKVDRENGCMKLLPRSHVGERKYEYASVTKTENLFDSAIVGVNDADAVFVELEPNQCSFHDSRIVHGADANTSPRRRAGYTMRYFSQQLRFNRHHPLNQEFKIWHARGKNSHNNPVQN
jgi:hypothetical protein